MWIYRFLARQRWHKCKYWRHWMYMKTTPPVKPTVTTTNFVQNGHPIRPRFTSSAARSINTHNDQITHNAAAQWNKTAQNSRRRSTPDISKLRHCWQKGKKLIYCIFRNFCFHCESEIEQWARAQLHVDHFIRTSLNGLIFVCMMNGNLHNSHEFVSDAVNHCCKHVWCTYFKLPEQ